ncbi:YgjP-like metallopeptidase domain-containing protein [Zavarzinia sp.]|uniref:YgjP-like metallopeptidase domain-containing protein n=1 Tax=Zavarzinia sp. TaxID=2027920 RepID=UPI003BB4A700
MPAIVAAGVPRSAVCRPRRGRCPNAVRTPSSAGTITLAADLFDEPDSFQDFVVAHERLHLRVPNHGCLFKALMTAHVSGWRSF